MTGQALIWSFRGIVGALRAVDAVIANIKSLVVGSGNAYSELTLADFRKVCGHIADKRRCRRTLVYAQMVFLQRGPAAFVGRKRRTAGNRNAYIF